MSEESRKGLLRLARHLRSRGSELARLASDDSETYTARLEAADLMRRVAIWKLAVRFKLQEGQAS